MARLDVVRVVERWIFQPDSDGIECICICDFIYRLWRSTCRRQGIYGRGFREPNPMARLIAPGFVRPSDIRVAMGMVCCPCCIECNTGRHQGCPQLEMPGLWRADQCYETEKRRVCMPILWREPQRKRHPSLPGQLGMVARICTVDPCNACSLPYASERCWPLGCNLSSVWLWGSFVGSPTIDVSPRAPVW